MKKVIVFALLIALLVSVAVPVSAAVISPGGTAADLLPFLISSDCDEFKLFSLEETDKMSEAARSRFAQARKSLPDAVPEDTRVRYFFYAHVCEECQTTSAVFRADNFREPIAIQYVDGEWIELDVAVNEDRTITVHGITEGPMAFLIRLKPTVVSSGCDQLTIVTEPELEDAPVEIQRVMESAKKALPGALPKGMLVRYFFYVDICEACEDSQVVFYMDNYRELMTRKRLETEQDQKIVDAELELLKEQQSIDVNADELVIKQYVGNKWMELEFTINEEDGTITVEGVVDGPMAFFVK